MIIQFLLKLSRLPGVLFIKFDLTTINWTQKFTIANEEGSRLNQCTTTVHSEQRVSLGD